MAVNVAALRSATRQATELAGIIRNIRHFPPADEAAELDLIARLTTRIDSILANASHGITGVDPNVEPAKELVFEDFPDRLTQSQGFFGIALSEEPSDAVTVEVTASNDDLLRVSPASLVFTPENWSDQQWPTLGPSGVPDDDGVAVDVLFAVSGGDFDEAGTTRTLMRVPD